MLGKHLERRLLNKMGCCGGKLKMEKMDEECCKKNEKFIKECCKDNLNLEKTKIDKPSTWIIIGAFLIVSMFFISIVA